MLQEMSHLPPSIPLTRSQRELIAEFYSSNAEKVLLDKATRKKIWLRFKSDRKVPLDLGLEENCPALLMEISKSIASGKNVQSAVFSECVYAQALANILGLTQFASHSDKPDWLPDAVGRLLASYKLVPRYLYKSLDSSRLLIQAGGHGGVDGALISVIDLNIFTIEFKEPDAKTSEPDLPRYDESGNLKAGRDFLTNNPQFASMVQEQLSQNLNFWENLGSNINNFSAESILEAVSENYGGKKFADVICTEDGSGHLVMIPSNQVGLWARLEGEIRPAGRNPYKVWTPQRLSLVIEELGGTISAGKVAIPTQALKVATERGGNKVSRYKLDPVFFVRAGNATVLGETTHFSLENVLQLKPTIAAKMFFEGLEHAAVRRYYSEAKF